MKHTEHWIKEHWEYLFGNYTCSESQSKLKNIGNIKSQMWIDSEQFSIAEQLLFNSKPPSTVKAEGGRLSILFSSIGPFGVDLGRSVRQKPHLSGTIFHPVFSLQRARGRVAFSRTEEPFEGKTNNISFFLSFLAEKSFNKFERKTLFTSQNFINTWNKSSHFFLKPLDLNAGWGQCYSLVIAAWKW